jgi:thiol-disulfide isomerase/thioredoxin
MRDLFGRGFLIVLLAALAGPAAFAAMTVGAGAAKAPVSAPYAPSGEMQNFTLHKAPRDVADIRFTDAEGRDLSLADFKGKIVLLNLWATWCAPCRREMPEIDALQGDYGGKDFVVLALSQDRKGLVAVHRFYREIGVKNLVMYIDQKARAARQLRAPGLPTTILLDRRSAELGRLIGPANWNSPDARKLIEHFLAN